MSYLLTTWSRSLLTWYGRLYASETGEEAWRAYALLRRMVGRNLVLELELNHVHRTLEIFMARGVTAYDDLNLALALKSCHHSSRIRSRGVGHT